MSRYYYYPPTPLYYSPPPPPPSLSVPLYYPPPPPISRRPLPSSQPPISWRTLPAPVSWLAPKRYVPQTVISPSPAIDIPPDRLLSVLNPNYNLLSSTTDKKYEVVCDGNVCRRIPVKQEAKYTTQEALTDIKRVYNQSQQFKNQTPQDIYNAAIASLAAQDGVMMVAAVDELVKRGFDRQLVEEGLKQKQTPISIAYNNPQLRGGSWLGNAVVGGLATGLAAGVGFGLVNAAFNPPPPPPPTFYQGGDQPLVNHINDYQVILQQGTMNLSDFQNLIENDPNLTDAQASALLNRAKQRLSYD